MGKSPMQLSLDYLRKQGYKVEITEVHAKYPMPFGKKHDLFGFADIYAYHPKTKEELLVQTTTFGNRMARVHKILDNDWAKLFLKDNRKKIMVHGWKKEKGRDKFLGIHIRLFPHVNKERYFYHG